MKYLISQFHLFFSNSSRILAFFNKDDFYICHLKKTALEKVDKIIQYAQKVDPKSVTTISDIQEKEINGLKLSSDEIEALQKFRRHRIKKLEKKQHHEKEFHYRYEYFRALSNLVDYRDYLNQKV